jgi:hypothetical protein
MSGGDISGQIPSKNHPNKRELSLKLIEPLQEKKFTNSGMPVSQHSNNGGDSISP